MKRRLDRIMEMKKTFKAPPNIGVAIFSPENGCEKERDLRERRERSDRRRIF